MGREVRRVPAGWEHPKETKWDPSTRQERTSFRPLHNSDFETAAREWYDEVTAWLNGRFAEVRSEYPNLGYDAARPFEAFWKWHGHPPAPEFYRPAFDDGTATHYQMYETVSEGTPVSPVFATPDELIAWLVTQGHTSSAARAFVESGWAPSMVIGRHGIAMGVDAHDVMGKE